MSCGVTGSDKENLTPRSSGTGVNVNYGEGRAKMPNPYKLGGTKQDVFFVNQRLNTGKVSEFHGNQPEGSAPNHTRASSHRHRAVLQMRLHFALILRITTMCREPSAPRQGLEFESREAWPRQSIGSSRARYTTAWISAAPKEQNDPVGTRAFRE